jgi:tRNA-Thr(GGU) m(6)t(6)A37 methyltransferase TsaA
MNEQIVLNPIGYIRSPFKVGDAMPVQSIDGRDVRGYLELLPEYKEGLKDLEGFSHIILIFHLHLNEKVKMQTRPFMDNEYRGIFATRSPSRPNHLGMSVVRVERVEDNRVYIRDLDMIDGTPLLDIKPYVKMINDADEIRMGWFEKHKERKHKTWHKGTKGKA